MGLTVARSWWLLEFTGGRLVIEGPFGNGSTQASELIVMLEADPFGGLWVTSVEGLKPDPPESKCVVLELRGLWFESEFSEEELKLSGSSWGKLVLKVSELYFPMLRGFRLGRLVVRSWRRVLGFRESERGVPESWRSECLYPELKGSRQIILEWSLLFTRGTSGLRFKVVDISSVAGTFWKEDSTVKMLVVLGLVLLLLCPINADKILFRIRLEMWYIYTFLSHYEQS